MEWTMAGLVWGLGYTEGIVCDVLLRGLWTAAAPIPFAVLLDAVLASSLMPTSPAACKKD